MPDNISEVYGLPVNTEGEVVARLGTGGRTVAGILPRDYVPVNAAGEMVVNLAGTEAGSSIVTAKTNPLTGMLRLSAGEADIPVTSPVTFAQLMIAVAAGFVGLAFVTDVGNGSIWIADGTRVRPLNGEVVLYKNGGVVNFATTTPRTIGIEVPLPISIWKDNDVLEVTVDLYKSGTTDSSSTQISIGVAGVVGSQLGNAVLQMASGGNRRAFGTFRFKRNSATSVTLLNGPNGQDGIPASSDLATTTSTSIPNMDSAQRNLQITNAMTAGGSDVVSVNLALVRLITA